MAPFGPFPYGYQGYVSHLGFATPMPRGPCGPIGWRPFPQWPPMPAYPQQQPWPGPQFQYTEGGRVLGRFQAGVH